jgi:3-oxoacyl-[acyl-carrier protein] reductase
MDLGLNGRTVIVTGAAGGIGREIARAFAAEGADLVLAHHRTRPETLAKEIDGRTLMIEYELADADSAQALVKSTLEWSGRIDVLVNNAVHWSVMSRPDQAFEAVPDEAWLRMVRTNAEGAVHLSRAAAPVMRQRRWGRIVHISSSLAEDGFAGAEYYAAAKAALHGFSRSVAFGLGRDGEILSNVVMPGLTRTETNVAIVEEVGEYFAGLSPLGRLLDAAEVARPVVYLGSAANTGITGQVIRVTAGA